MSDRQIRVELHGGPKDGWAYDLPLHWEKGEAGGSVWLPPLEIRTATGTYRLPATVEALGYDRFAAAVEKAHHVAYEWVPDE